MATEATFRFHYEPEDGESITLLPGDSIELPVPQAVINHAAGTGFWVGWWVASFMWVVTGIAIALAT